MARPDSEITHREILPDLVRAVALMGIAVVNAASFAHPLETGLAGDISEGSANFAAAFGMYWLAAGKFYALFSLMFGVSLFYQAEAAKRADANFNRRQTRRLIGLGLIGLVHYAFFFIGDILVTYALLGALLLTQLSASQKTLVRIAIALILIQVAVLLSFAGMFAGLEAVKPGLLMTKMSASMQGALETFTSESFFDQAVFRLSSYGDILPGVLLGQGISTFGYFCLGLAFARSGWISDSRANIWRRARWVFLPAGLTIGAGGAWLMATAENAFEPNAMLAVAILFLAAPLQALGYAGLLAGLARRPGVLVRFLSRAGQASLTAYLLQSLIMTTVFSGWGFGLYGQLPAAQVILVGAGTALFTIVTTAIWMSVFKRGPVESAFRAWTYG